MRKIKSPAKKERRERLTKLAHTVSLSAEYGLKVDEYVSLMAWGVEWRLQNATQKNL